jgi:hypothetical protein
MGQMGGARAAAHHGGGQLRDHGHVDGDVIALAHALALHVVGDLRGGGRGGTMSDRG